MDIIEAITLAIVQGLTEFLPISSSAHLILLPKISDWHDQGLAFDIALHLGTLSAVVAYYQRDIRVLFADLLQSITTQQHTGQSHLAWGILLATIPVGLVGLLAKDFIENNLREIDIIAYATIIFGLLLALADNVNRRCQNIRDSLNLSQMMMIGFAQALALIPGTSRSGITITAALLLGLNRTLAAKFCFLLSIPVIVLSALLALFDLLNQPNTIHWLSLSVGFIVSAVTAYLTIGIFIKVLNNIGLLPFVIYRLGLGMVLLLWL